MAQGNRRSTAGKVAAIQLGTEIDSALREERQRCVVLEDQLDRLRSKLELAQKQAADGESNQAALEELDERLDHMAQLGKELNALGSDQLLVACERHLPFIVGAQRVSLYLHDPQRRVLKLHAHNHTDDIDQEVSLTQRQAGLMAHAMSKARIIIIREIAEYLQSNGLEHLAAHTKDYATHSCALVPLIFEGEALGVLNLADKKDGSQFTETTDRKFLQQIADLLTIAIRNHRLVERLEHASRTDALCQLRNRSAFLQDLDMEVRRIRRYGGKMAVLLADIDGFGLINSNHGHAIGDRVLIAVGRLLHNRLRDVDVVGRYADDTFAAMLPHQHLQGALVACRRVVGLTRELNLDDLATDLSVGLSIGLACLEDTDSFEDLLARAEEALAEAKVKGNRVISRP